MANQKPSVESNGNISVETLLAHIEDNDRRTVAQLLAKYPNWLEEVQDMAQLQQYLTERLYRISCLSSQELTNYYFGHLSKERIVEVSHHLQTCPHCAEEYAQLTSYLITLDEEYFPEPLSSWQKAASRVQTLVAELIDGITGPSQVPAWNLLGSQGAGDPIVFRAGDAQITIQIEEDDDMPNRHMLIGLIVGIEPDKSRLRIWHKETPEDVTRVDVDEFGAFVITALPEGEYELILEKTDTEIHIPQLII